MNRKRRKRCWSEAAGDELYDLIYPRWTPESVSDKAEENGDEIDPKTVRNWFWSRRRGKKHCPSKKNLAKVCRVLGIQPDYFRPFIDDAKLRRAATLHPHSAVSKELKREVDDGGTHVVQLLAPPGYLKTEVLRDLERALKKKRRPCVYIDAASTRNVDDFWQCVAERFQAQHIPIGTPKGLSYYTVLSLGVEGRECVLLIDNADSWLVVTEAPHAEARTWLSSLFEIPCLVVVSGLIDLTHLSLITGGTESDSVPTTLRSAWNDRWNQWTAAICDEAGVRNDETRSRIDFLAQRHPGAFVEGIRAAQHGEDAEDAILRCHDRTARRILRTISPRLRSLLIGDGLDSLSPLSLEGDVLVRGNVLRRDKNRLRPVIREWGEFWAKKGLPA